MVMNLADVIALTFLLLVGGYIFAVGVLPQILAWIATRIGLSHPHAPSHPQHPTLS
jgi:hypothetical protein